MKSKSENSANTNKTKKKSIPSSQNKSNFSGKNLILVLIPILLTFLVFFSSLKNNFTNWDDGLYVIDNPHLAKPIGTCIQYFFTHFHASNYHPLTMILLSIEFHLDKLNPAIYHQVSLFLHLCNVFLVFWFVYLLSGKKIEVALFVAVLFGVHPMHVESVAWISELKDVLYSAFFMGGLITYYKHATLPNNSDKHLRLYLITIFLFLLSVLSKPAAITFPFSIILIDFYLKREFTKKLWMEKIPFLALSLLFAFITFKAQVGEAIVDYDKYTLLHRAVIGLYAMVDYIVKMFLPVNLSAFYPFPPLVNGNLPAIFYIMALVGLGIFFLLYWFRNKSRLLLFGFLFFFMNIILVLQFLTVGMAVTADRYTYIPYIGLFFIFGMWLSKWYTETGEKKMVYRSLSIIIFLIITGVFSFLAFQRTQIWFNSETLWTNVIEQFPNDAKAYKNRAGYLTARSKYDIVNPGPNDLDRALVDFTKSLSLKPDAKVFVSRASVYRDKQKYEESIADYTSAIKLEPAEADHYFFRAIIYAITGNYEMAFADFNSYSRLGGDNTKLYKNRALAYFNNGKYNESIEDYKKLILLTPDDADVYYSIGDNYANLNNFGEAITYYTKSIQKNPKNGKAYDHRSKAFYYLKDKKSALDDALKAKGLGIAVDPAYLNSLQTP